MSNNFMAFTNRIDVAPNISIGLKLGEQIEKYGDSKMMYDLASLTKVFCGVLVIKLAELNYFKLDHQVNQYMSIKSNVTIRQLLIHTSGFTDEMLEIKSESQQIINWSDKENSTGTIKYADINYIILYQLISKFGDYEQLLDKFVTTNLDIVYKPNKDIYTFAPTELRANRGLVSGEVHDNKAYKMGEISGHAGLFANIDSLIAFFYRLVNGEIIQVEYFNDFSYKRNLLFETQNSLGQMGNFECKGSFHSGFTGTSVLIDFEEKQFIIILTNRISPSRLNSNIFNFRQEVHNNFYKRCKGE
ncbi:MAG: serine hydrolase domain-containing protein [Bacilli bacterium]